MRARPLEAIPIDELMRHGVWEYDLNEEAYEPEQDETWMLPVRDLPVDDLLNRITATEVTLANGAVLPAIIGGVSVRSEEATREFITVSLATDYGWFHLARYFDVDCEDYGPDALADRLGLRVDEIFPLCYDVSRLLMGLQTVTKGSIPAVPDRRLSAEERMQLLFRDL